MSREWVPIPGETPIDPSGLKDRSIRTRSQLIKVEAENILKATVKYLAAAPSANQAPFTYGWFLKLHGQMFGDVWTWAGQVRTHDLSLGISWKQICPQLGKLVLDIEAWPKQEDLLLQQAVEIHHRAVQIHPFENGNGRWSRLLANIWLRQHGKPAIEWPEAEVGQQASSIRNEYIEAIIAADNNEYALLIELHRRYLLGD
jgi:Fic-DOC domain mobile mystery protein B